MAGRWPVVNLKTSTDGITFSVVKKKVGKFKWLVVSDFTASVTAKPTKDSSAKEMKAGTSHNVGSASHGLQHKFSEAPIFAAGDLEASENGGSGTFTVGYAGKNFRPSVKFSIISLDDGKDGEAVDVDFLQTTPSFAVRGIWEVNDGGPNWEFTAQVSITIGPDKVWILKKVGRQVVKRAMMKGLGKGFGLNFAFIEGGYLTIEAYVMSVIAGAGVPSTADKIENIVLMLSTEFMRGAMGGSPSSSVGALGRKWFEAALAYTQSVHPKVTFVEFRAYLRSPYAKVWYQNAKAQVQYNIRLALFRFFEQNPEYWADDALVMNYLRRVLRLDKKSKSVPITPPKFAVIDDTVRLPEDHISRRQVPPLVQRQVRTRVRNNQNSGTFHFDGVSYQYRYNRATNCIEVRGGGRASNVAFDGFYG
jgi:hypothetical protein